MVAGSRFLGWTYHVVNSYVTRLAKSHHTWKEEQLEQQADVLFDRWYIQPLRVLNSLPRGDGGFIALATSCFLYERYATAVIKSSPANRRATTEAKIDQFMQDFGVDKETATAFWNVIRDGLLHAAMPMQQEHGQQTLPAWAFRHNFPLPVELTEYDGKPILKVQPWLVMEKVISLWQNNLPLLEQNDSFPWAGIAPLPFYRCSDNVLDTMQRQ